MAHGRDATLAAKRVEQQTDPTAGKDSAAAVQIGIAANEQANRLERAATGFEKSELGGKSLRDPPSISVKFTARARAMGVVGIDSRRCGVAIIVFGIVRSLLESSESARRAVA